MLLRPTQSRASSPRKRRGAFASSSLKMLTNCRKSAALENMRYDLRLPVLTSSSTSTADPFCVKVENGALHCTNGTNLSDGHGERLSDNSGENLAMCIICQNDPVCAAQRAVSIQGYTRYVLRTKTAMKCGQNYRNRPRRGVNALPTGGLGQPSALHCQVDTRWVAEHMVHVEVRHCYGFV